MADGFVHRLSISTVDRFVHVLSMNTLIREGLLIVRVCPSLIIIQRPMARCSIVSLYFFALGSLVTS